MAATRRTLEIATASALGLFAAGVIAGSLQLNTGWAATGPQSGYVPLRLGVLLLVVSALLLLQAVRSEPGGVRWSRALALGVVATLLFFLTFEIWFGVPLAKGPLETWLGF